MKRKFNIQSLRKFGGQETYATVATRIEEGNSRYVGNVLWTKPGTIRRRNGFKYAGRAGAIMPSETYRVLGKYTRPDGTIHLAVASAARLYDIDLAAGFATEIMNGGASIANCFAFAPWKGFGYYVMQNVPGASNRIIQVGDTGTVTIGATTGAIVGASQAVVWKDRIWKINTNGTSPEDNYVRYSGILASTFGVNDFVNVAGQNDGYVTAIAVYNDLLYIFKNNAVYALSADGDAATWQLRLVHSNIGCVGTNTVLVIDGMLYFYSQDGMYRTDGTNFQEISEDIRQDIRYVYTFPVRTNVMNMWAAYIDRHIILYIGNKNAWVYSLDHEAWSIWEWNDMSLNLYGAAVVSEYTVPELHVGIQDASGRHLIMPFSPSSTGGAVFKDTASTPFTVQWISPFLDSGLPGEWKRHMYTEIEYTHNGSPTITVSTKGDFQNFPVPTRVVTTPGGGVIDLDTSLPRFARAPSAGRHRNLQISITQEGDTPFELVGVHWALMEADAVGRNLGHQS